MPTKLKTLIPSPNGRDGALQQVPAMDGAESDHDTMGKKGPAFKLTRDELFALQGSPHHDIVFYLHLRTKMDFGTGQVGVKKYGVSWGRMAALSRVQPHPGLKQISMTIDVVRGCAERLKQRGLVNDATQGRRLGFLLPMALTDHDTVDGNTQDCFRISRIEIDRLTGVPHGVIVLYLQLRAMMDLQTGTVGIQEKVSWDYLGDLLRIDADKGRRAKTINIDQVRRMANWLTKLQLIDLCTEGRQLIFRLPFAHADFHASQQAASTPTAKPARSPRAQPPGTVSETDRYIEEQRQAESTKRTSFPESGSIVKTSLSPSPTVVNGNPCPDSELQTHLLKFADWINVADRATMVGMMSDLSTVQQQQAIDKFQHQMGRNINSVTDFFKWVLDSVRKGRLDTLSSRPPARHQQEPQAASDAQDRARRAEITQVCVRQNHDRAEAELEAKLSLMGKPVSLRDALGMKWSDVNPEFHRNRDNARAAHAKRVRKAGDTAG
ncbi:hypothetical protein [Noviherbaspirillum malthae]|uniref:hypothetical protein n=1 Tax=Noviherbaspirillum malthae TaxID=1260987 RepID=UPI00188FF1E6|nr:hypothetical protein [Noviherbaspirillum malthae]